MDGRPALGSATPYRSIYALRVPWGGPQFHPPGEHPAAFRWRWTRAKLEDLLGRMSPFSVADGYLSACEALVEVERKLADFEAGEDRAKERAWEYIRRLDSRG